jgi:hypothetical protein
MYTMSIFSVHTSLEQNPSFHTVTNHVHPQAQLPPHLASEDDPLPDSRLRASLFHLVESEQFNAALNSAHFREI